ncbi:MAG TPA: hypothetical protein DCZ43_01175, partial [candidate division Zixibacteria bacterium]|nr:hypothetical protein [candidate division Zixibacteria bacterium]
DLSIIEGIIGRGDRRLGKVILSAHKLGSRLDGWSEWFTPKRWYDAFVECGIDPEFYSREIPLDAPLPWDHIDKGISKTFFQKDNQQSKEAIPPSTAFDHVKPVATKTQTDNGFGRKPKRIIKQTTAPGTYKVRVRYARGIKLRYLSHLDIIRTLYRALRRAELPVAYSEGFHPHIKISFGQPLPLGYTSDAEYFDLQLSQPYREEYITRLKVALPSGLQITGYKSYFANVSSLTKQLNLARYVIPSIDGISYDPEHVARISSEKSLLVSRTRNEVESQVDAGKFIENLELSDKGLILDVSQTPDGLIKPDEILIFGLGIDLILVKPLAIHRSGQFYRSGQRLIEPLDLV